LSNEDFSFDDKILDADLFSRRVADKYLMLLGGYGDYQFVNDIKSSVNSFPCTTISRLNESGIL